VHTTTIGPGLAFSRIGLGGWELAGGDVESGEPSPAAARSVIEAAIAGGVSWIDTAEIYFDGRNEALIGAILADLDGEMYVATKLGPSPLGSGFRSREVEKGCRASLRRLRRETLDVCFLHWPDETGVPLEETWAAMSELVEQGLVRSIGLSNYSFDAIERCHEVRPVDLVQVGFSAIDRRESREVIRRCERLGVPVFVYEPLANGILTGKPLQELGVTWGRAYRSWDCYERLLDPAKIEGTAALVDRLQELATLHGLTLPELALAWVLSEPGVTAAIVGTRDPAHVTENAGAAAVTLEHPVLLAVEEVVRTD
jgi:aryl-alcohol dehydrogenase-like predicted oxidoreductase